MVHIQGHDRMAVQSHRYKQLYCLRHTRSGAPIPTINHIHVHPVGGYHSGIPARYRLSRLHLQTKQEFGKKLGQHLHTQHHICRPVAVCHSCAGVFGQYQVRSCSFGAKFPIYDDHMQFEFDS